MACWKKQNLVLKEVKSPVVKVVVISVWDAVLIRLCTIPVYFQDLLYRRTRALVDYENSNKALDKARLKSKDVRLAEAYQQDCCQKFEKISESAKQGKTRFAVFMLKGDLNAVQVSI